MKTFLFKTCLCNKFLGPEFRHFLKFYFATFFLTKFQKRVLEGSVASLAVLEECFFMAEVCFVVKNSGFKVLTNPAMFGCENTT